MRCNVCGAENPDGSGYCVMCGSNLSPVSPQVNPSNYAQSNVSNNTAGQMSQQPDNYSGNNSGSYQSNNYQNNNYGNNTYNYRENHSGYYENNPNQNIERTQSGTESLNSKVEKHSKKIVTGVIIAVAISVAVILMIAGAAFFLLTKKTTVDLEDYVNVTYDGYDTRGTAVYTVNRYEFLDKYEKKIKLTHAGKKQLKMEHGSYYKDFMKYTTPAEIFYDRYVYGHLSKNTELSNGDTVTFRWDMNEEDAKKMFKINLKCEDIDFEVEGLTEIGRFDPFDGVEVMFSGIAPNGKATLSVNNNYIGSFSYDLDKDSNLSNGDEVTVKILKIYGDLEEYCIENYGAIPEETEKTYEVTGLSEYIKDTSEIPEDIYNKMNTQLQDTFNAHVASSWDPEEKINDFKFIGNYFVKLKDGLKETPNNYLYFVYKVTYSNDEVDGFVYYWYGYYKDIMILSDGTCTVDLSDYTVSEASYGWLVGGSGDYLKPQEGDSHYVAGYADLETFFNKQIVSKVDKYEYTNNIQE